MAVPSTAELKEYRNAVIGKLSMLQTYESEYKTVLANIDKSQENLRLYSNATQLLRTVYENAQQQFHTEIQKMVTDCLRLVFGSDAYTFKINFTQKRNQVEAVMVFERDGEEFNPKLAAGGGVLAVACFALRLAVIHLTRKTMRSIMILDEPFERVSGDYGDYADKVAELLNVLAKKFNFQFIIVTHKPNFEIGRVYRFDTKHNVYFAGDKSLPEEEDIKEDNDEN